MYQFSRLLKKLKKRLEIQRTFLNMNKREIKNIEIKETQFMTYSTSFRISAIESNYGLSSAFIERHLDIKPTKILNTTPSPYDSPSYEE